MATDSSVAGPVIHYQNGNVVVEDHFVRFGSKSYALNKINSVDVTVSRKISSAWLWLILLGVVFLLFALGQYQTGGSGAALVLLIMGGFFIYSGIQSHKNRITETYHLMFATSSGEAQATKTKDGEAVQELRRVIEAAIVARG